MEAPFFVRVNQVLVRLWARLVAACLTDLCNRAHAFRGDMFCAE